MDKKQESKIKRARAISEVLASNNEIVKNIPKLEESHIKLDQLIIDAEKFSVDQRNTGTEITKLKEEAREDLEKSIILVSAALAAYATSSDDATIKTLKTKYQIKDSIIKRMRDMTLHTFGLQVYNDALPYGKSLDPFASADDINDVKINADEFNKLLPKRRKQLNSSVASTQNLVDTINAIDTLTEDTIDILIKPFQFKYVDFYNAFQNANVLIDAPSRKNSKSNKDSKKADNNDEKK